MCIRDRFLSCVNLAGIFLETGDYGEALENAQRGLRISQEANFELFEMHALDLIGSSYLKLGDLQLAIHFLEQALASARKMDAKVNESVILLDIGEAYREMRQLDRALDYFHQGMAIARAVGDKPSLVRAHALLSELYEQQGNAAQALIHFKQHTSIKDVVFSEKADKRLKVLQVTRDIETAKKEAEILHRRPHHHDRTALPGAGRKPGGELPDAAGSRGGVVVRCGLPGDHVRLGRQPLHTHAV